MSLYFAIPISLLTVFVGFFLGNLVVMEGDRHEALHCTLVLMMGGALVMTPLVAFAAMFFVLATV